MQDFKGMIELASQGQDPNSVFTNRVFYDGKEIKTVDRVREVASHLVYGIENYSNLESQRASFAFRDLLRDLKNVPSLQDGISDNHIRTYANYILWNSGPWALKDIIDVTAENQRLQGNIAVIVIRKAEDWSKNPQKINSFVEMVNVLKLYPELLACLLKDQIHNAFHLICSNALDEKRFTNFITLHCAVKDNPEFHPVSKFFFKSMADQFIADGNYHDFAQLLLAAKNEPSLMKFIDPQAIGWAADRLTDQKDPEFLNLLAAVKNYPSLRGMILEEHMEAALEANFNIFPLLSFAGNEFCFRHVFPEEKLKAAFDCNTERLGYGWPDFQANYDAVRDNPTWVKRLGDGYKEMAAQYIQQYRWDTVLKFFQKAAENPNTLQLLNDTKLADLFIRKVNKKPETEYLSEQTQVGEIVSFVFEKNLGHWKRRLEKHANKAALPISMAA